MKTQKINLAQIKNKLTRAEMKEIMAGSGGCPGLIECPASEEGNACPDVGTSTGCTCRKVSGGHVCNP